MAKKQWPQKFRIKFRNIDRPLPYLGNIPKKTTFFYCFPNKGSVIEEASLKSKSG